MHPISRSLPVLARSAMVTGRDGISIGWAIIEAQTMLGTAYGFKAMDDRWCDCGCRSAWDRVVGCQRRR